MTSKSVITINQLAQADAFPAYVAIHASQLANSPFVLSPTVMLWSDDILLCKVDDCEQFWLAQARKSGCDLTRLFDQLLQFHYGENTLAVFANHPWQCLVYLGYQMSQQAQGIYFLQTRLNRNIYKTLGWRFWFAPQDRLASHFESSGAKRFNAAAFRTKQSQLRRFVERVGLAGPFELKQADHRAITRRFDGWLGKIWRWSFNPSSDLQGFPWVSFAPPVNPVVNRDLEYPLNQWSYIEVLLQADFALLCGQFENDETVHVNRMLWQITLFNDQVVCVELSFRHPYSLHRESPEFGTAMYQARYVYDSLIRKLQTRDADLDLPETMPFISWRVEVCERIHLPPVLWDLFARDDTGINYEALFELQNKLPVTIESYRCDASFYPELSFSYTPIAAVAEDTFDQQQWSTSATDRPLFYYDTPQAIETPAFRPNQFLERCASRWWLLDDSQNHTKDYYVLKDGRGKASWVYRNHEGNWFKQGEYI
ncbi:MAG: hypothetical protein ACI9KN_001307 [Gammaproteobacteria bacterium]|jgi:hypothetical protein